MKKITLFFMIFGLFALTCFAQDSEQKGKVMLKAGTEISAQLQVKIDASAAKVGDDFSLITTQDFDSDGGKILKGSTLSGRIVEVEKSTKAGDDSTIGLFFDFFKVGENFLSFKGAVIAVKRNEQPLILKFTQGKGFQGETLVTEKAKNLILEKGDVFQIKIVQDVKTDN